MGRASKRSRSIKQEEGAGSRKEQEAAAGALLRQERIPSSPGRASPLTAARARRCGREREPKEKGGSRKS